MKKYFLVNDLKQGVIVETQHNHKPLLLFVHGGPGFPIYPFVKAHQVELEEYFDVCYWDQRGTGMSYTEQPVTLEQLIDDGVEIVQQLLKEYNRDKLFLLGHSWGTILGTMMAERIPESIYAYIGIGQIRSPKESERETYLYLQKTANKKEYEKIAKVTFDDQYYKNRGYGAVRSRYTNKYGVGFKRAGYSTLEMIKDTWRCPHYTLGEKLNMIRGSFQSYQALGEIMSSIDLVHDIAKLEVPVYIMQGRHDYLTTYTQAKRFYDHLEAPYKKMYVFEESAHTPFYDEKTLFFNIIEEIAHTEIN